MEPEGNFPHGQLEFANKGQRGRHQTLLKGRPAELHSAETNFVSSEFRHGIPPAESYAARLSEVLRPAGPPSAIRKLDRLPFRSPMVGDPTAQLSSPAPQSTFGTWATSKL